MAIPLVVAKKGGDEAARFFGQILSALRSPAARQVVVKEGRKVVSRETFALRQERHVLVLPNGKRQVTTVREVPWYAVPVVVGGAAFAGGYLAKGTIRDTLTKALSDVSNAWKNQVATAESQAVNSVVPHSTASWPGSINPLTWRP